MLDKYNGGEKTQHRKMPFEQREYLNNNVSQAS